MRTWWIVGLCSVIASCGGGDSNTPQVPVATVSISPNPIQVQVGSTVQLEATLSDADGNELTGRTVTWSSTAVATATVDQNGLVEGLAEGSANIQAESEGKSATAAVAVSATPPPPPDKNSVLTTARDKNGNPILGDWFYADAILWEGFELLDPPPEATEVTWMSSPSAGLRSPSAYRVERATAALTSSVLFAGGYAEGSGFNSTRKAVLLDPATYAATTLQMNDPRIYHTMTRLSDSQVLVVGGFDGDLVSNTAEIFTEATGQFVPTGAMSEARGRHAAALLSDGRVLITGGLVPVGGGPVTVDVATSEIFDPVSGSFTAGPAMNVARFNHSAISLDDGRVLILGGNRLKSAEVYDPAGNTFTPVGDMEVVHGLGHQAVKLLDGRVLVVGGDSAVVRPTAVVEIFDPQTDQFTRVADMATGRMLHFAVLTADGTVVIGGGQDDEGELLASVEVYDPVANAFTPGPDLPAAGIEPAALLVTREE